MLGWLLIFRAGTVLAQDPAPTPLMNAVCTGCRIEAKVVATLELDSIGSTYWGATRTADGRYLAVGNNGELGLFDATGRFLRRVGRNGAGPGEFKSPSSPTRDLQGRIHVLDFELGRHTILGRDLKFVASTAYPLGVGGSYHTIGDSALIFSGVVRTSANAGYSFHRTQGPDIANSFGPRSELDPTRPSEIVRYSIATRAKGGFWAMAMRDFRLERRDNNGKLLQSWKGAAPWFKDGQTSRGGYTPENPPPSTFIAVGEDSDGLVLALVHAAGPRWKEAFGAPGEKVPGVLTTKARPIVDYDAAYQTHVVAIDPATNQLVAEGVVPANIVTFADPEYAASYNLVDDVPTVRIWRITVVRPSRKATGR